MKKDMIRELISQRIKERGTSEMAISVALGKNKAYMNQFLNRGIPAVLDEETRENLSSLLQIDERDLKPQKFTQNKEPIKKMLQPMVGERIAEVQFGPDMVPILGHANGSSEAVMLNINEPIGEAPIHPNQRSQKNAFALYAQGESMSPRYMQGELVYAIMGRSPLPGADCIIELLNGEAYLKQYTRYTDKEIICRQLNPERDWKRPKSEIKAIHAVVGRG